MKYIRTKDGIFDIEGDFVIEQFKNNEIIEQADTIEELCDVLVGIRKSDHKPYLGKRSGDYYFAELGGWLGRLYHYEIIYGAIWTDKRTYLCSKT